MSKLAQLREEREALAQRAAALNNAYGNRAMPAAEAEKLDSLLAQIEAVDRQIGVEVDLAQSAAEEAIDAASGIGPEMRNARDFRAYYARQGGTRRGDEVSLSDFFRGVAGLRTSPGVKAALSEGTDTAGGFSVPSLVMPQILEALTASSSLLSAGASIVPLDDGAKTYTLTAISTVPTAAWRSEAGAVAESDPVFRGVTITPRSLAFYFKVSRELLADSGDLDRALRIAIAQSMAVALDAAGLRGSGSAPTPRGLLNTAGVQAVTNGANGASLASSIKYANLNSACQLILEANAPTPTAAIMSPRSLIGYSNLADSTGQPLRRPPLLDPLKFIATGAIPNNITTGTSNDTTEMYVGDFTSCSFFMRERLSVQVAKELYAGTGQIAFVCHVRADFAAKYPAAIAVATGIRP